MKLIFMFGIAAVAIVCVTDACQNTDGGQPQWLSVIRGFFMYCCGFYMGTLWPFIKAYFKEPGR